VVTEDVQTFILIKLFTRFVWYLIKFFSLMCIVTAKFCQSVLDILGYPFIITNIVSVSMTHKQ